MATPSDALIQALAVTAEVTGTEWSAAAARAVADALAAEPEAAVLAALARCRREVTGRLTLAAIVERLDDGRPGPEAAWAGCPRDEGETAVWTAEQRAAFGAAAPLLAAGDRVGARMAFLETYRRLVAEARAARMPVAWTVSLGHDPAGRAGPIEVAVAAGRLSAGEARALVPALGAASDRPALAAAVPIGDVLTRSLPAEARAAFEAELAAADAEVQAKAEADRQAEQARREARVRALERQAIAWEGQGR